MEGAVSADRTTHWQTAAGAVGYRVGWRDTTAPQWQHSQWVGDANKATLKNIVVDDAFFGVSAVSKDGYASPVVFAGAAGAFFEAPGKPK